MLGRHVAMRIGLTAPGRRGARRGRRQRGARVAAHRCGRGPWVPALESFRPAARSRARPAAISEAAIEASAATRPRMRGA